MQQVIQDTFDDLGHNLSEITFVVVDLETTGGSRTDCEITEIGAVKVRGGEVLGEFQTLVRPRQPIPPFIQQLTGITNAMVADAEPIEVVLPLFLDFARDTVLVAHNAGFDIGFLKEATRRCERVWPGHTVLDTVALARQLVHRDEAPNHKLSSLAALFSATTTPDHRALHDARATVDVLHALIARVGNRGVRTLEDLQEFCRRVTPAQRRKRFLADEVPNGPGVYMFKDRTDRILYVGTARDLHRRVRTYFTASEQRRRIADMINAAESVATVQCATVLEAEVRELRLIAEHRPPFNRRSKDPQRSPWVKLTNEPFPRLSVVREVRQDGATYLGPFGSRSAAESAIEAIHEVVPLRQCGGRISLRGTGRACALADIGRCGAPCVGRQSRDDYALVVQRVVDVTTGASNELFAELTARMEAFAARERYEEAAAVRNRTMALIRGLSRIQRLRPLALTPEIIAARRRDAGGWEVVCVRYGRLAGTLVTAPGADPMPAVDALQASAEITLPGIAPAPAASAEETEKILRWLETPGTRLVHVDGEWSCPIQGAQRAREEWEPSAAAWSAPLDYGQPTGSSWQQPPGAVRWAG